MPASPATTTIARTAGKTFCGDNFIPRHAPGTLDAVSLNVDWKFAKKFDLYAGMMFSQVRNGSANGYLFRSNLAPTAGLRFQF